MTASLMQRTRIDACRHIPVDTFVKYLVGALSQGSRLTSIEHSQSQSGQKQQAKETFTQSTLLPKAGPRTPATCAGYQRRGSKGVCCQSAASLDALARCETIMLFLHKLQVAHKKAADSCAKGMIAVAPQHLRRRHGHGTVLRQPALGTCGQRGFS